MVAVAARAQRQVIREGVPCETDRKADSCPMTKRAAVVFTVYKYSMVNLFLEVCVRLATSVQWSHSRAAI